MLLIELNIESKKKKNPSYLLIHSGCCLLIKSCINYCIQHLWWMLSDVYSVSPLTATVSCKELTRLNVQLDVTTARWLCWAIHQSWDTPTFDLIRTPVDLGRCTQLESSSLQSAKCFTLSLQSFSLHNAVILRYVWQLAVSIMCTFNYKNSHNPHKYHNQFTGKYQLSGAVTETGYRCNLMTN